MEPESAVLKSRSMRIFSPGRFITTFVIWIVVQPIVALSIRKYDAHQWTKWLFIAAFVGIGMGFYEGAIRRRSYRNSGTPR